MIWTTVLTAVALAAPAGADPFVHLEPMLAPVPDRPAAFADRADDWSAVVDRLEAARKADEPVLAACSWAVVHEADRDGADADADELLAREADCLRRAKASAEGKGSKVDRAGKGNNLMVDEGPGAVVRVFYGTDRVREGDGYGGAPRCRGLSPGDSPDCLDVGVVEVNIPDEHRFGEVESEMPAMWTFTPNPKVHLFVVGTDRLDHAAWTAALKAELGKASSKSGFVYIHGYNNSFDSAAMRAAQMTYDLKFPGVPMMYSWGSAGALSGYFADEDAVRFAVPHLRAYLQMAGQQAGVKELHIVAHSMGNRVIAGLLESIERDGAIEGVTVKSLILAAPDVDADVFRTEVVPRLASLSSHTSLYVNAGDKALAASKLVHGSKPRAGAVPIEADGLDTIDATTVGTDMLGHAYFGSVPALLRDIQATWTGTPVPERDWLDRDHTHWTFHAE